MDSNRILISLGNSTDGLEVGIVVAWTLPSNPSDSYLECNGQVVDSSKYPKLYALMHNTPDYRGVFLRGLGSVISNHYGTIIHTSDNLGILQGDAIRNITGELPDRNSYYMWTGVFTFNPKKPEKHGATSVEGGYRGVFDASRVVPVANENRPVNKAVRYFIKAK